jgi:hypothetical protein
MILFKIPELFGIGLDAYGIMVAISLPVFLLWCWLLKRSIKSIIKRRVITLLITIFTTPLIYMGIIVVWLFCVESYPKNNFNRKQWLADKEKRYELSDDIIQGKLLIGMTKKQVKNLLGDEHENYGDDNDWGYYLGFKPELGNIDPASLHIEFKDGKVENVYQMH